MSFPNNFSPDDSKGYSFCKVSFNNIFRVATRALNKAAPVERQKGGYNTTRSQWPRFDTLPLTLTYLKSMFLFFQTIDFPQRFFETPTLVTTTKHLKDDVNSRVDADNNAITEWIEVRMYSNTAFFLSVNLYQTRISLILSAQGAKSFTKGQCNK